MSRYCPGCYPTPVKDGRCVMYASMDDTAEHFLLHCASIVTTRASALLELAAVYDDVGLPVTPATIINPSSSLTDANLQERAELASRILIHRLYSAKRAFVEKIASSTQRGRRKRRPEATTAC